MRKSGRVIFLILSLTLIAIIYWQWTDFTGKSTHSEIIDVEHQIEISHIKDRLLISQTFFNVRGQEIPVHYPESATNFKCGLEQNIDCPEFINAKNKNIHFHYEIPFDPTQNSSVLQDWYVKFDNMNIKETTINISVDNELTGEWVTSAPLIYNEEMENVHYFSFESKDNMNFPLIWSKESLTYATIDGKVFIYSQGEVNGNQFSYFKNFTHLTNKTFPTLILTDNVPFESVPNVVVAGVNDRLDQIELQWTKQFLMDNYWSGKEEDRWIIDLLAAYMTDTEPDESLYPHWVELKSNLTDSEKKQWFALILQGDRHIDAKVLDEYLGTIKNLETNFFEKCESDLGSAVDMYFTLDKPIVIHGEKQHNEYAIVKDQHVYFPFEQIVTEFGFDFKQISDSEFYLTNGVDVYRFYRNRDIFIKNEEQYGFFAKESIEPILDFDGEIYVSEKVFTDILDIKILKLPEEIFIY